MVRTSLDSGYLPLTALQDAKTCQDTIIFEDLFASFDVMIIINKEAPAQGADCKARDALHECQQTKRPEKHVDGSCQTLRQQLQGWQNTSTGSNTDNQGKNWWLSMDAQSNTDRIPCKESQDITSDSMSDSFLCDWIQLRSTKPGFWSLSSSEASFRANTQTNKALLDESVVSFANIHNCNVCTLHRNLLAIRTSLTLIQIHDYLIHTIPLVWTDRLWCCPGQLSKSHEAEKYRIEGQQEYDNFDNWSNCHHHVQVVYPISPELASEKKDARNHVQDKHGCKKHIARRKYPSRGRRREWQGIGRALARLLKWAWWLGVFFLQDATLEGWALLSWKVLPDGSVSGSHTYIWEFIRWLIRWEIRDKLLFLSRCKMSSVEGALSSVCPSSQEIHMIQVIDIEYIMWTDLCVCILTGFNEPLCSWFTYSYTMFYTWPQGSRFKQDFSHGVIMLGSQNVT